MRFNVLFNSVSVISGRCEGANERLNALEHRLRLGAPVSQWVKSWPTDLAVPSSIPTRGEIFSTVNGVPLHTAFHYQHLIVLIWLKYCWKGHPSIHRLRLTRFPPPAGMELGTAWSADKRFTHCAMGLVSLQKSLAESPGIDHDDASEVRVLNEKMAQTTCIRAAQSEPPLASAVKSRVVQKRRLSHHRLWSQAVYSSRCC